LRKANTKNLESSNKLESIL